MYKFIYCNKKDHFLLQKLHFSFKSIPSYHKMILLRLSIIKSFKKILHYNHDLVYFLDYGKRLNLHTINLISDSCDE